MERNRAAAALASGHIATARRNWLRAMNYYQAAAYPIDLSEDCRQTALVRMRDCAAQYLQHRQPVGEVEQDGKREEDRSGFEYRFLIRLLTQQSIHDDHAKD